MGKKMLKFLKDWFLVIGMTIGVLAYVVYAAIPEIHCAGPALLKTCQIAQPIMLFMMLFFSFCKIHPGELKPHRWQIWMLLIQTLSFIGLAALIRWASGSEGVLAGFITKNALPIEAGMLCMICPTATACAVMTGKLGGNIAEVVTYTIIINFAVALLVPAVIPMLHPEAESSFILSFLKILGKVFPLLILPFFAAMLVRYKAPKLHKWLIDQSECSFYIWGVSLTLAMTVSTREIAHCGDGWVTIALIALASLIACVIQFAAGIIIGRKYGCEISAAQALGQKNTVFAIWMGYTFLSPVVSVAGGFYSIWHNIYNSWQLYRQQKRKEL